MRSVFFYFGVSSNSCVDSFSSRGIGFGDCGEISSEEIDLIESHKFENIITLYWRNSNLNFSSSLNLLKSLEEKPKQGLEETAE